MATKLTPRRRSDEARALLDSPHISSLFEKVRLASEAPAASEPAPRRPNRLWPTIGVGLLCTFVWWNFSDLRSPALRAQLPGGSHAANPAIGDTCLYYDDFFPKSAVEPLRQLEVLKSGATHTGERLAARGIAYPIFVNLFTSAFDSYYAPWALSLVFCWLCAAVVPRMTGLLFRDRAKSIFAATCFGLSIVAAASVGESGPRLLGIFLFYLWTLLLVRLDAEERPIGWRGGIGLAALLGLWSLVEIGSLAGLAIYAVFAMKRRKLGALVLAGVAWCVLPIVQELIWQRFGFAVEPNRDLARIGLALQQHGTKLMADPLGYSAFLAIEFGNLLFAENPLNVLICVVGLGFLRHPSRWLLRVCFVVPILIQMLLLPISNDRGVAIAGNSIVVFALLGHFAVEAGRRFEARFGAQAFAVPLVALAALQAAWGASSLVGWDFPARAFATGPFREAPTILPTKFARLTGSPDEVPTVLGGPVRASRFSVIGNAHTRPPIFPVDRVSPYRDKWSGLPSLRPLVAAQAPLLAALLIATLCLARLWRGLGTIVLFASAFAAALLCGASVGFSPQDLASFEDQIHIKPDEKLTGSVRLSPEFQSRLEDAALRDEQIEFLVSLHAVNRFAEHAAEFQVAEWSAGEPRFTVSARSLMEAVRARKGRLEFSITAASASKGLWFHSWQTIQPRGARTAQLVHADGTQEAIDRFPSFEVRVVRPKFDSALSSVIERYDHTRPAGYSLVGF